MARLITQSDSSFDEIRLSKESTQQTLHIAYQHHQGLKLPLLEE